MKVSSRKFETIVGALVLLFAVGFGFQIFSSIKESSMSGKSYSVSASFDRIDGLKVGSLVKLSGISVGKVISQSIDYTNYNAAVVLEIEKECVLPADTSAEIVTDGIIGEKYISLVPGSESDMLSDGATIEFTQSPLNIESIIGKFAFGMDNNGGKKAETAVAQQPCSE